jgi:hypothetical protein
MILNLSNLSTTIDVQPELNSTYNQTMDKIQAIKYLLEHGDRDNEWAEAGMLSQVAKIVLSEESSFDETQLDELIVIASARAW